MAKAYDHAVPTVLTLGGCLPKKRRDILLRWLRWTTSLQQLVGPDPERRRDGNTVIYRQSLDENLTSRWCLQRKAPLLALWRLQRRLRRHQPDLHTQLQQ